MSLCLLDQPPHGFGAERSSWPLRVLLLADLPGPDRTEWIGDRSPFELRADALPPAWAPWRGYGESPPGTFARVRTSAVPCTSAELREDLDDAPSPSRWSLAWLAERPLRQVIAHWPFSLMVVEPALSPGHGDDAAFAEAARCAGAPIVRDGAPCGPWVLSDPARVPSVLTTFARTGWAGDGDPELALALLAGRIASWARYLFASRDEPRGDVSGTLAASVPFDRFRWVDGDEVVGPAIRHVSFSVTEDIGAYDVEMELAARLGPHELAGRFPFRVERR